MKSVCYVISTAVVLWSSISFGQTEVTSTADSTGLPGDHFSLQGALDLFKSSNSLDDFENKLNSEENSVNNLDLNGDGDIDYIRVIDNKKDSVHAIVLQVPVSETESQDIAVIELEKNGRESASVQIIGDEELYGEKAIVEPFEEKEGAEGGKNNKGPSAPVLMSPIYFVVNVWMWPCVSYVYAPAYVVWVSPWRWHSYPMWWRPWRPHPWRWHYTHCMHYYAFYRPVGMHRMMVAHSIYAPHRQTSAMVGTRFKASHDNYRSNRMNARPQNNRAIKQGDNRVTQHPNAQKQNEGRKAANGRVKPSGKSGGARRGVKGGRK